MPHPDHRNLDVIGGWLVLLALSVVLRPLVILAGAKDHWTMISNNSTWITLTDSESFNYKPAFAYLSWIESFMLGLFIAWSCILIVQFFRRKASYPISQIYAWVAFLIFTGVNQITANQLFSTGSVADQGMETAKMIGQLIGNFTVMALWIAYLSKSRRVKATFRH